MTHRVRTGHPHGIAKIPFICTYLRRPVHLSSRYHLLHGGHTFVPMRRSEEKVRKHHHYLKGTAWCGTCGHHLIVSNNKTRYGTV